MKVSRPALRYYGGKWNLAPWVIEHFPAHEAYIEPFGGAASVLLRKQASPIEVYNDLDGEVVNFFRVLRERADELVRRLQFTPFARGELRACETAAFEHLSGDPVERARWLYVRSWQGRGAPNRWRSGWRYQRTLSTRTRVVDDWSDEGRLFAVAARLRVVLIEEDDAFVVIGRYDGPGTLFYVDRPYQADTRSTRWATNGYKHEMTDEEHRRLAAALREVEGMVVVSGYPSALMDELYEGWECVTRATQAEAGKKTVEALWISASCATQARQGRLRPFPR